MKDYLNLNDYEVMYMIGENDEIAKDLMFKKYSPIIRKEATMLYKCAKRVGLEMDDLIQEGYLAVSSSMKRYDPNKEVLFYTYVMAAIRRKMLNLIRISSAGKHTCLNDSVSLDQTVTEDNSNLLSFIEDKKSIKPHDEVVYKELSDFLKNKLYEFNLEYASILELKINGFKSSEIATLLSISRYSVTSILSRIRRKLSLTIEK